MASGPRAPDLAAELTSLLERYVSPTSALAVVQTALAKAKRGRDQSPTTAATFEQLEISINILIAPSLRSTVLAAVREVLEGGRNSRPPPGEETVVQIRSESDLNATRMFAREACHLVGIRGYPAQKIITAVSELARNIACYVGAGEVRFRIDPKLERIVIVAEDHGSGIPDLPTILAGEYRSRTGLGRGILGVKSLADHFDIQTGTSGTKVVIGFDY